MTDPKAEDLLRRAYALSGEDPAETKALYRDWAETYDGTMMDGLAYVSPIKIAALLAKHQPDRDMRVLDVGCGVGTAGLCLVRRVPNVKMAGVELQPELQALATLNAEKNGLSSRAHFARGDIRAKGGLLAARSFDHVFSNPPYIAGSKGRSSDSRRADISKRETEADLAEWIDAMLYWVKERGHITIIHRADRLHEIIELLSPRVGALRVCPVWPKRGRNANRVIVQGRREAKAGMTLSPGIVVRHHDDTVTREMEEIQRHGLGLSL